MVDARCNAVCCFAWKTPRTGLLRFAYTHGPAQALLSLSPGFRAAPFRPTFHGPVKLGKKVFGVVPSMAARLSPARWRRLIFGVPRAVPTMQGPLAPACPPYEIGEAFWVETPWDHFRQRSAGNNAVAMQTMHEPLELFDPMTDFAIQLRMWGRAGPNLVAMAPGMMVRRRAFGLLNVFSDKKASAWPDHWEWMEMAVAGCETRGMGPVESAVWRCGPEAMGDRNATDVDGFWRRGRAMGLSGSGLGSVIADAE